MSQRPFLFRQNHIARAFRAARAAGVTAARVDIAPDGTIRIFQLTPQEAAPADAEKSPFDTWKDERNARSA